MRTGGYIDDGGAGWRGVRARMRVCASLLAFCAGAFALDPSLDITQYAHATWKLSETFGKGTIWAISQTPDGYLWLGTEFNLRRFDGVRTVEWRPPARERLPNADIRNLLTTRDGTLWIGTGAGLASWKPGKFTVYHEFDGADISALLEDHEGTVWAAGKVWQAGTSTPSKLCAISAGAMVRCFESGRFGPHVTTIYEDSRANLWLGAGTGVWRFKPGPPVYFASPDFKGDNILFPKRAFLEDGEGGLLITGPQGIHRLKDGKLSRYPLPPGAPPIRYGKLLRDRDGSLWIGTWDTGLLHVHEGRVDVFAGSDGLINQSIENLFEDREGNIWAGGVNGLDEFREFSVRTISVRQGLSSPYVLSVLGTRDGSVWLATSNGLDRWKDGLMTVYRKRTALAGAPEYNNAALAGHKVREVYLSGAPDNFGLLSLYEDSDGVLWVTHSDGYFRFQDGGFSILRLKGIQASWQAPVARDSAGNVWVAEAHGLYRLSGDRVAAHFPATALALRGNLSGLLVADPLRGGLWVGSWQGGVVHFKDGQVRASYGRANGLRAGSVHALLLDSRDALWAATDVGVSRIWDGRVTTLNSGNGLPCDNAHAVALDNEGALWIYMECGLVSVSRSELEAWIADPNRRVGVSAFDFSEGVKSHAGVQEFAPRMTKSLDGKIWFTSFDGVSVVDPHRLRENREPPQVVIERITVNGKQLSPAQRMRLPPRVRQLGLEFTALSFTVPDKVRLRFKLESQDPDWREVVGDRKVEYSNLPPRNYRFRVIACNNSGVWNETGATLEFSIAPAYYQTTWFLALCAAAVLGAIWGLYRLRLYQVAREFKAQLDGRVEERLRVARDLHDTLLQTTQGSLILMQAAYNLFSREPERARETLQEAITSSTAAIAEGRDTIQNMRSSAVTENDLARALHAAGKQMAAEGSATFDSRVQGSTRNLHPILRDEVYRIALEALRNAFQHAEARAIEAEVQYGDVLRVRIRDDGKGIAPEILNGGRRSGHYGLTGMRERAATIGGELDVRTGPGVGTEIQLTIPGAIAFDTLSRGSLLQRFRRERKSKAATHS